MKWAIYRGTGKDKGKPLHESITQYDGNGDVVYQDTFEYVGKWMGECYLTVSIKSPYPIDFQIGDYIEYRGEKFTINYDPTVIKKARRGTYGEGFVYDSIKFNSYSNELTMMLFHDWVLDDNKVHYTSLPTFSFYAKDVDDLADRLQACADRWCKDNDRDKSEYWMFYTLANNTQGTKDAGQYQTTYERTVQRAKDISTDSAFVSAVQSEWTKTYGDPSDYKDSRDDERYDRNISISNNTVWDGLQKVKTEFGLNFIIRGRNVYIGTVGIPTSHLFEYGKGKGLYEVDKTADTGQKVVTRLHAYGSDQNMPTRYYAELNVQPFGVIESVYCSSNEANCTDYKSGSADYLAVFYIDIPFRADLFRTGTNYDRIGQKYNDTVGYIVKFHLEGSSDIITAMVADEKGMAAPKSDKNYCQVIVSYDDSNKSSVKDWSETDHVAFLRMSAALQAGKKVIFDGGIKNDAIPAQNKYYNSDNLPDNMAVNSLMLPGFPLYSLADICKSEYDSASNTTKYKIKKKPSDADSDYVLFHTESGKHLITFSNDRHDPYLVSQNVESLGYRDGDISCTESNDDNGLEAVYPSIEKITVSDAGIGNGTTRLDVIDSADTIDDNGVYDKEGVSVPSFHVTLPKLGFDLRQAAKDANSNGEFKLSMKDGFCGGREFTAKVESVDASTGKITLRVQRSYDDSLSLWFPYSYAKSVQTVGSGMTNAYQILSGDHFVLTGINVSDVNYVWTASVRLLRKAIHWLCKNDYTRYVYTPKIDEIFMARQDLEAKSDTSGKTASIHDTLKEGDILLFDDDDLLINGSVYIDQLSIKENGNKGIPTYDVTLRNEVNVGTLQRIQNKVDSVANDIRTGNIGGNVGMTPTQVDPLVKAYGDKYFLSKTHDDETAHKLTMGEAEVTGKAKVGGKTSMVGGATVGDGTYGIDKDGIATLAGEVAEYLKSKDFNTDNPRFGSGLGMLMKDGVSYGYIDYLTVRTKMTAEQLEVRVLSRVAGDYAFTKAGSHIVYVEVKADRYRCYYTQDDGTTQTINNWQVGDFAKCKTSNIKTGKSGYTATRYYNRLVIAASSEPVTVDGLDATKKYGYIDLAIDDSNTIEYPYTDSDGNSQTAKLVCTDSIDGEDVPQAQDDIVQWGNAFANETQYTKGTFKARGNVLLMSVSEGGLLTYTQIDHPVDGSAMEQYMTDCILPTMVRFSSDHFIIAPYAQRDAADTVICFRDDWNDKMVCGHNDVVRHSDKLWQCIVNVGETTNDYDETYREPKLTSPIWKIYVKGIPSAGKPVLTIAESTGEAMYISDTDIVTLKVQDALAANADADITSGYGFSVTRNSGNTDADTVWNTAHASIATNTFELTADDLTLAAMTQAVTFTVTAKKGDSILTMPFVKRLTGKNDLRIEFSSNVGPFVSVSRVDLQFTGRIMFGDEDITATVLADSRNTFVWTRDSGIESEDKSWVPTILTDKDGTQHPNILCVHQYANEPTGRKDCGSQWEKRLQVKYTLTATIYTDTTYNAKTVTLAESTGIASV